MELLSLGKHVRAIDDPEGAVVLNIENGCYYSTNSVGAQICTLLQTGITRSDLVQYLSDRYELDGNAVSHDLDLFLQVLREKGLLQ